MSWRALLAVTNKTWLLYYLGGDIARFFVYKMACQDFMYWVNAHPSSVRFLTTLLAHAITKAGA